LGSERHRRQTSKVAAQVSRTGQTVKIQSATGLIFREFEIQRC
jgi:hypothetical protein